jgi:hypothetical protein
VEQAYPLSAPNIAGFRLDALHTIKHTVKSTPTNNKNSLDTILESIEGLVINRGTLYIRVSAVQVVQNVYLFLYFLSCCLFTRNTYELFKVYQNTPLLMSLFIMPRAFPIMAGNIGSSGSSRN